VSGVSRGAFLGTTTLAAGAASLGAAEETGQAYQGHREKLEALPTFRFAMEQNKGHVTEGGSARQATVNELPISKGLARVSIAENSRRSACRPGWRQTPTRSWRITSKSRSRSSPISPNSRSSSRPRMGLACEDAP
jgi:oxalate decarboxylase